MNFLVFGVILGLISASEFYDRPQYICNLFLQSVLSPDLKGLNKAFPGGWLITDPSTFTQQSIDRILQAGQKTKSQVFSFLKWIMLLLN